MGGGITNRRAHTRARRQNLLAPEQPLAEQTSCDWCFQFSPSGDPAHDGWVFPWRSAGRRQGFFGRERSSFGLLAVDVNSPNTTKCCCRKP